MTKASPTRIEKKMREKEGLREWPCPKSGLHAFQQMIQRHQNESRQLLNMMADDAGVPEGAKAEFDGEKFVLQESDDDG